MIGDLVVSLARKKEDKVRGTGRWHIMKNRYGPDGLTFMSLINTSNGRIHIEDTPLNEDEDKPTTKKAKGPVNPFSNVDTVERDILKNKFLEFEIEE